MVKRVVGLSGDKVQMQNGYLFLNQKIIKQKNDGELLYLQRRFNQNIEQLKELYQEVEDRIEGVNTED